MQPNKPPPPDLFGRAIILAAQAHAGMVRKGSSTPYIVHPMEAAAIAATMTNNAETLAAAVLHDVVEDTDVTIDEVRQAFGDRVAAIVSSESEDKRKDRPAADTWLERKQEAIDHLGRSTDEAVKIVALADKLSNLRAIHRDSVALGDAIWQRFNQKDKTMHAWYCKAMGKALECLSPHEAYKEYLSLLDKVFGDCRNGSRQDLVWYACYGSNLLLERFLHYLQGGVCRFNGRTYEACRNPAPPMDSRPFAIPFDMYFGFHSDSWDNGGVSFLDASRPGSALGRVHLITKEQLEHVHEQECRDPDWYDLTVELGTLDGIPVRSFTNHTRKDAKQPSAGYLNVIRLGLRETYPQMDDRAIDRYLFSPGTPVS